jgi:hypothetical protein
MSTTREWIAQWDHHYRNMCWRKMLSERWNGPIGSGDIEQKHSAAWSVKRTVGKVFYFRLNPGS